MTIEDDRGVVVDAQLHDHIPIWGDLRRHHQLERGIDEFNRRVAVLVAAQEGDFAAVFDRGLALVGRDHTRTGDGLEAPIRFAGLDFEV